MRLFIGGESETSNKLSVKIAEHVGLGKGKMQRLKVGNEAIGRPTPKKTVDFGI
jgi:hypothetical protein